jgi:uncharacterized cupin superfamily protein
MLQPGSPSAMYHSESVQESFLVLGGNPTVILNDRTYELKPWDFVHYPAEPTTPSSVPATAPAGF